MQVQGFTTGVFQSNCYLIVDRTATDAVIIDPGQDSTRSLVDAAQTAGAKVHAVLLTHGHIDHVWNAAEVTRHFDIPSYLHPADRFMLDDPGAAIGAAVTRDAWALDIPSEVKDLNDGDQLKFGNLDFLAQHAPGHTPGHCIFKTDGLIASGDLIMAGSVGRTDFPKSSTEELFDSIRRLILPLDDDYIIISGHGPETTVGKERASNPFLLSDAGGTKPRLSGL